MYIHQNYVGDFTGEAPDLTNATYLEVDFTEDVMCYTGPGPNYESKGITSPGGPHTLFAGKIENGFAFIDTVAYDNIGMRVWVDASKVIGLPENEEPDTPETPGEPEEPVDPDQPGGEGGGDIPTPDLDPISDITAQTIEYSEIFYGPGSSYKFCDGVAAGSTVYVLWKEGDWYCVECSVADLSYNSYSVCGYIHSSALESMTGTPYEETDITGHFADLGVVVTAYTGPGRDYAEAGEVLPEW